MSPKPAEPIRAVKVGRALETLRRECPTPEQTEDLLARLHRPRSRRSVARPLALAMTATALALALVFPPRAKSNFAWAQTLAATLDAPASHAVSRWSSGEIASEEWRSGVRRATVLYLRTGEVQTEMRNDGRRAMFYSNHVKMAEFFKENRSPNARDWAIVTDDSPRDRAWYETPLGTPQTALADPDVKVVAHQEAADGKPETYRLRQTYRLGGKPLGRKHEFTAEIDPTSGRIRALVEDPRKLQGRTETFRTEIDYPSRVPETVFAPRPQAAKGVEVFDGSEEKTIARGLRQGLGKRGPVTLRAVVLTGDGDLWAFWTGALPDPKLARPFSTPGVPCGAPFTNRVYTTAWRDAPKMNGVAAPTKGPRLGGMGRTPLAELGRTVDLDVPYKGGVARFRNVPLVRIGMIQHISGLLGTPRDYR